VIQNQSIAMSINGQEITLGDVLRLARLENSFQALDDMKRMRLIEHLAAEREMTCSNEELQAGVDEYRKKLGLYTTAETKRWLEVSGLSLQDLAIAVRPRVLLSKLQDDVQMEQVSAAFADNKVQFEAARLSRIVVAEEGLARELRFQLMEGEDFAQLAKAYSMDEGTKFAGGYMGIVGRTGMTSAEASAIFGAKEGDVVGVLPHSDGFELLRVDQLIPAELNKDIEAFIRTRLVDQMLETYERNAEVIMTIWDDRE
jgi:parvulin-like peptidyl-prolyl isomerase